MEDEVIATDPAVIESIETGVPITMETLMRLTLDDWCDRKASAVVAAFQKHGITEPWIDMEFQPTPSQMRSVFARLGIPIQEIHDRIQATIPADKADAFAAEVSLIRRQNEEEAGALKNVTERPDQWEGD